MSHPVENIMQATMAQLKEMVDVSTIVGDAILTSGETMVLPVSKVSLGFVSGGGEYGHAAKEGPVKASGGALDELEGRHPFAGASAAGMCMTPVAFLSVANGNVRVLPASNKTALDRAIEMLPEVLSTLERLVAGGDGGAGKGCEDE